MRDTAIVCYYADFGRPYAPLIEQMTESARRVMPNAGIILLSPTPDTKVSRFFDATYPIDSPTSLENLCRERARALSSWAVNGHCERTIFVDPDIVFQNPVEMDDTFDVGLVWRTKPDQPVNTGLILMNGRRNAFWRHYGTVAVNLPVAVHYWWADQLAFALLTGICHKPNDRVLIDDARVWLMDADKSCPVLGEERPDSWAVHHKGRLKGPGWEKIYRGEHD